VVLGERRNWSDADFKITLKKSTAYQTRKQGKLPGGLFLKNV
jgi:hypothetical protein